MMMSALIRAYAARGRYPTHRPDGQESGAAFIHPTQGAVPGGPARSSGRCRPRSRLRHSALRRRPAPAAFGGASGVAWERMDAPSERAGWQQLFWLVFERTSNPIALLD